jgi:hypothetical protein
MASEFGDVLHSNVVSAVRPMLELPVLLGPTGAASASSFEAIVACYASGFALI